MPQRLFAALVPPPTALHELESFVAARRDADPALRWAGDDSWHVTTAFAAAVSSRVYDRLVSGLRSLADRTPPIDVTLGGAGAFPNPAAARVLYLAAAPNGALADLGAASRQAFSHAGIEVDGRTMRPHLTLARLRRPANATKWLQVLDAAPPASWRATHLLLIESHLRDRGQRYEVHERFRFGG